MLFKAGINLINKKMKMEKHHLWIACQMGHMQVVEQLIQAKADLSIPNNSGNTPLYEACREGHCK